MGREAMLRPWTAPKVVVDGRQPRDALGVGAHGVRVTPELCLRKRHANPHVVILPAAFDLGTLRHSMCFGYSRAIMTA